MESMYQRSKIQEEPSHYEKLKNSGELPIVGVNTFLGSEGSPNSTAKDVMRSTEEEKIFQIRSLEVFQKVNSERRAAEQLDLKKTAPAGRTSLLR